MALYENFIIENKIKNMLDTKLEHSQFYTVDNSLTQEAGMTKKVHRYTATGAVRTVAQGEGNIEADDVTPNFVEEEYTVAYTQGRFIYFDEQLLTDPTWVDTGIEKNSVNMANDLTSKFYIELGKTTQTMEYPATGINFDTVVDATAKFGENEEGLFLLINPLQKAAVRKALKDDLKYVEGFIRTGYIGSINNIPVYVSSSVPADTAFIANKEAVTVFLKKDVEVEQERDANLRKNKIYTRRCNVVALTDENKVVKLTKTA